MGRPSVFFGHLGPHSPQEAGPRPQEGVEGGSAFMGHALAAERGRNACSGALHCR